MTIISSLIDRLRGRSAGAPRRLPSPDELALLTRPDGEPVAMMLRGILDQQGIPSMIKNRDALSIMSGRMGPPWAYELWVLRKDLRRAREVLDLPDESGAAER